MRRFIAYIITSVTMLLAIVVGFTPVFTQIKPGREYTTGQEFVYELRQVDTQEGESEVYIPEDDTEINKVATEMRARLDTFGIEDYSVTVEGKSSVRVSVSISDNSQRSYVRKYLAFNGGHFALSTTTGEDRIEQEDLLGDNQAYIIREQDLVPWVIIPVKNVDKVRTMVDSLNADEDTSTDSRALLPKKADDGEETQPDLFLWNNVYDDDNLNYSEASKDRVFMEYHLTKELYSGNFWYKNSKEEKTEIGIIFGQADEENNYDTTKLEAANKAANAFMYMINASKYSDEYQVVDLFVTESSSGVTYNEITTKASVEELLSFTVEKNIAMSVTLVSSIIAFVIISLILVLFYRSTAVSMIANTTGSVFLTYLVFILFMRASFNPAAVIGGVLLAVGSLLGEIYYANKFKEEVYKGRLVKKANTEATKRTTIIAIDIAVVMAFLGLMLYLLGGSALKPMGIVLFFGAIINLVMTLVVFRLLSWLLTNTTKIQEKYRYFNIDPNKVPNIANEQKVNFEGNYADKNFTKFKKPALIASLVLLVASVIGIVVFGVIKSSPLNVEASGQATTNVYVSLRLDNPTISDTKTFKDSVLANVKIGETALSEISTIDYEERTTYTYESDLSKIYHYYVVSFAGSQNEEETVALENSMLDAIVAVEGEDSVNFISVDARGVKATVGTPNQGFVALATGLGILGAAIYFAFRYRPSRALAMGLTAATASAVTFGILTLTRISTTAITSLAMPMVAVFAILSTIYFFNKEKDIKGETKEELTKEKRKEIMVKAVGVSASSLFVAAIVAAYIGINFFGFGPMSLAMMFAGFIFGVVIATLLNLMVLGVLSNTFENWFSKIHLPKFKRKPRKERIKLKAKKNSSEPEETIFIGINDF